MGLVGFRRVSWTIDWDGKGEGERSSGEGGKRPGIASGPDVVRVWNGLDPAGEKGNGSREKREEEGIEEEALEPNGYFFPAGLGPVLRQRPRKGATFGTHSVAASG